MKTIKQILAEKTIPTTTIGPDEKVIDAVRVMGELDIGALLVIEGDKLVGIFTERDCLQKVTAQARNPAEIRVCEVMTEKVRFVTPDLEVSQSLALMTERRFRHLPVLDSHQKVIGIISIGDLVKAIISEQTFIIEQLERYITS
jgi:CBS domain-containing protein